MGDDEQRAVDALTVELDALRHGAHRVDVKPGVSLVKDGKLRFEHQHLEYLRLFLFAAGETDVQVALGIVCVHMQKLHRLCKLLLKVPQSQALAGLLLKRAADKGAERHSRHFERVLERKEYALVRSHVYRQLGYILAVEYYFAGGHGVLGVAGNGIAQRGFARAVWPHEDVSLILADRQINAVEYLFVLNADVKVLYFKQIFLTHICSTSFRPRPSHPLTASIDISLRPAALQPFRHLCAGGGINSQSSSRNYTCLILQCQ